MEVTPKPTTNATKTPESDTKTPGRAHNMPITGQPIGNDPHLADQDEIKMLDPEAKHIPGKGKYEAQPGLPDLTEGARYDKTSGDSGSQRNPGRPGDVPEEHRGAGTRTGGSPQGGMKGRPDQPTPTK